MSLRALGAVLLAGLALTARAGDEGPLIAGLDHIPIAVRDLEQAGDDYRRLGFTLKPGRVHEDGIRNLHAKFADGTELELITAGAARDALTRHYVEHLRAGDGPAFLGLYAPDQAALKRRLDARHLTYEVDGLISLTVPGLSYLFFGTRERSPTDKPEHFVHANGADGLIGVWLATDITQWLDLLGAPPARARACTPQCGDASVSRLAQGEVVLVPTQRRLVRGRPIVGAVLRSRDIGQTRATLAGAGVAVEVVQTAEGRSVFVPPVAAHGVWLEFRQQQ